MLCRVIPVLLLLFVIGQICQAQDGGRLSLSRRMRQRNKPLEGNSDLSDESNQGSRKERLERRRRPAGRRPGRQRGRQLGRGRLGLRGAAAARRVPGGRPRRPPAYYDDYYYDDYYYDAAYSYDDQYPDYDDDTEDAVETKPPRGIFSPPTVNGGDTGDSDYHDIIRKLWEQFLVEQEGEGTRKTTEKPKETECEPLSDVSYYEPDEDQCDKYYECNIKGEIRTHLCPDGFTFDPTLQKCDYPVKVNCTTRPNLQEPQPSTNCSRANGFFAWPANESCQNFWDCREGTAYPQTCPVGVIFDPQLNTCATPDQSTRTECTQGKDSFLGFSCPNYTPDSVLRFGNHDRLPHPEDCHLYFTCLRVGGPRLATCPKKKVFNKATGQCGKPEAVEGCETYWIDRLKDEDYEEEYYD